MMMAKPPDGVSALCTCIAGVQWEHDCLDVETLGRAHCGPGFFVMLCVTVCRLPCPADMRATQRENSISAKKDGKRFNSTNRKDS